MRSATTSRFITASRAASGSRRSTPCASSLPRRDGKPNLALADFVAPKDSGKADYIGAFVVTAGAEEEKISARYARANDDYGSIMVKALADRIAEAFAERMHERARREFWGYARERKFFARRAADRALSRHSPGARLSRAARPYGKGDDVRSARRAKSAPA